MTSDAGEQIERMLRRYQRFAERAAASRAEVETAEPIVATSADHMVTATVTPTGQLVDLQFQQAAFNRGDKRRLAASTMEAINQAMTQAATAQLAPLREILGDDTANDRTEPIGSGPIDPEAMLRQMRARLQPGG